MTKRMLLAVLCMALTISLARVGRGHAAIKGPTDSGGNSSAARAKRKVLYLTHSAGFKHDVLPLSEQILKQVGERSGAFEVTATQDCSLVSRGNLKQYDAVVFYTTGELPISGEQKAALLDYTARPTRFTTGPSTAR